MKKTNFLISAFVKCLLLLILSGYAEYAFSQQQKVKSPIRHLKLAAIGKAYEDSIVIRWAPATPQGWILGNKAGYHITRVDITDPHHPIRTTLGQEVFTPMPKKQILATLDTTDEKTKYITIAEKMLYDNVYSTSRIPAKSFVQKVKNEYGALNLRYLMAMMAADYYPPAADVLALRWVDKQVKKGGKYVYIIYAHLNDKNYVMDSAGVFVINTKIKKQPVPQGLEIYGYDKKVEVRWNRLQNGNMCGYYLERSDDGGHVFHPLTQSPYNSTYIPPTGNSQKDSLLNKSNNNIRQHQQVYFDSIAQNYKPYYYRLRAINSFGELTPYTEVVSIQGRDLSPPLPPHIDSAKNISGNQIKIWWTPKKENTDLAGYYIDKGFSAKGPFTTISKKLLPKEVSSFVDSSAAPHQANYYAIVAVDTANNVSISEPALAFLKDSIAPVAPVQVAGTIDSNGVVHLQWKNNTEDDLLGYQVYSSYNPSDHFSQVNNAILTGNRFIDTVSMKSLDRHVFYKVVALDKNYNSSPYSAAAELKKPIVIPPSAPLAGTIDVKPKEVNIEWIQSQSEGATGYEVFRKEKDKEWMSLGKIGQQSNALSVHFIDTTLHVNTDYYYAAETIDSSGIRSPKSFAVHVRSNQVYSLGAPANFSAIYNTNSKSVDLSWKYKDTGDYFFVVYRSVNNGTLQAWQSFDKEITSGT
ncbi:MAG: fibronectin type III domain-containing protein, partial [Ginsengibacter sp.]